MKLKIVADSSIDSIKIDNLSSKISFTTVPFVIATNGKEFMDDESLNIDDLIANMIKTKEASRTSCPPSSLWYNAFEGDEDVIAITVSSNLSGSFNSALAAKQMILEEQPDKHIEIINSLSAGPSLELLVEMIDELYKEGKTFDEIVKFTNEHVLDVKIAFAFTSFDNLIKSGRINKIAGFIAGKIGLCGIGIGSDEGKFKFNTIVLGPKRLTKAIIDDINKRVEKVKEVIIHHVKNIRLAAMVSSAIKQAFPKISVIVKECRGLCSFYAEKGGLIYAFR